jgi:hypothetical protein
LPIAYVCRTFPFIFGSLHHHGPDGRRHWISSDRRAGLGHARLSIFDQKDGRGKGARVAWDQPLMMLTSAAVLHDRYGLAA